MTRPDTTTLYNTAHVVCSPKEDYLAIITAYLPDPEQWEDNLRKRKNK